MDPRFDQLAKLVGQVLARRWMEILAKNNPALKPPAEIPPRPDSKTPKTR
jgi:hypothetical protein